jgi:hypothetical protein
MSTAMAPSGMTGTARAPRGAGDRRLRRLGVGLFFGSVVVNAVLGIAALLIGEFSETHGRILGTSLSVTGALLLGLACLPAWERGLLGLLPLVGAALGVAAFSLVVISIWTGGESDTLAKLIVTVMAPAVAQSHVSWPCLPSRGASASSSTSRSC